MKNRAIGAHAEVHLEQSNSWVVDRSWRHGRPSHDNERGAQWSTLRLRGFSVPRSGCAFCIAAMLISRLPLPGVPRSLLRNGDPASARATRGQLSTASSRQTMAARSALFGRSPVTTTPRAPDRPKLSARELYDAAAITCHDSAMADKPNTVFPRRGRGDNRRDRKSTRLNSSHVEI